MRVGNVMIDTLMLQLDQSRQSRVLDELELRPREFAALTMHRPSNVDNPDALRRIFAALGEIARKLPIIFPAHPRTQARMREFGILAPSGVRILEPMGYIDFLRLWSNARLVLTDSGGLQEETTALGIPCLTLRENTERPITVEQGTNQIVGSDPERIKHAAGSILRGEFERASRVPELWDGHTAERIVDALIAPREIGRRHGVPASAGFCSKLRITRLKPVLHASPHFFSPRPKYFRVMKVLHVLDHSLPYFSGYSFRSNYIITMQRRLGLTPFVVTSPKHEDFSEPCEMLNEVEHYPLALAVVLLRALAAHCSAAQASGLRFRRSPNTSRALRGNSRWI